jgi:hypothetical protein
MFYKKINRFFQADSGAITVDFVVITALVVGFGIGVLIIVAPGIDQVSSGIGPVIETADGLGKSLVLGNN